jgi:hypothetical protein
MYDFDLELMEQFNKYFENMLFFIMNQDFKTVNYLTDRIDSLFELNDDLISSHTADKYEELFAKYKFDIYLRNDIYINTPYVKNETAVYYGMGWSEKGIYLKFELSKDPHLSFVEMYFNWVPNVLENKKFSDLTEDERKLLEIITAFKGKWIDKSYFCGEILITKGFKAIIDTFDKYGKFLVPWKATNYRILDFYFLNEFMKRGRGSPYTPEKILERIPKDVQSKLLIDVLNEKLQSEQFENPTEEEFFL